MVDLESQLVQLENAQLVRRLPEEERVFIFKHALTQEAAYESLLLKKRSEIHRLVAQSCEKLYADRLDEFAALLAQHYDQAGDKAKTLQYSIRAQATRRGGSLLTPKRLRIILAPWNWPAPIRRTRGRRIF